MAHVHTLVVLLTLLVLAPIQEGCAVIVRATINELVRRDGTKVHVCCFHEMLLQQQAEREIQLESSLSLLKRLAQDFVHSTQVLLSIPPTQEMAHDVKVDKMLERVIIQKADPEKVRLCDSCAQYVKEFCINITGAFSNNFKKDDLSSLEILAQKASMLVCQDSLTVTRIDSRLQVMMPIAFSFYVPMIPLLKEIGYDVTELEHYFAEYPLTIAQFFDRVRAHLVQIKTLAQECYDIVGEKGTSLSSTLDSELETIDEWLVTADKVEQDLLDKVRLADADSAASNTPLFKFLLKEAQQQAEHLKDLCKTEHIFDCETHNSDDYSSHDDDDEDDDLQEGDYLLVHYMRMTLGDALVDFLGKLLVYGSGMAEGVNGLDTAILWHILTAQPSSRIMLYTGIVDGEILQKALTKLGSSMLLDIPLATKKGETFDSLVDCLQAYSQRYDVSTPTTLIENLMRDLSMDIRSLSKEDFIVIEDNLGLHA